MLAATKIRLWRDCKWVAPTFQLFYHTYQALNINNRTLITCDCLAYHNQIGKCKCFEKHPLYASELSTKMHEPTSGTSLNSQNTIEKTCAKCLSVIGRGYSHSCTQRARHKKLETLVQTDPMGAEQISSSVIANNVATPRGTVCLSQGKGGQLFPATPGNE